MNKKRLSFYGVVLVALLMFVTVCANAFEAEQFSDSAAIEKASSTQDLSKKGSMTFDKESYVFKGKAIKPKVIVYYNGTKIKKDKDYKLTFENNDAIGNGRVTCTGKGKFTGSFYVDFPIVPQPTKFKKINSVEGGFEASWKAVKDVDGYEIEYARESSFKDSEIESVDEEKTVKTQILKLEPKATYFIRVRTYVVSAGLTFYSAWSKAVKFKVGNYQKPGDGDDDDDDWLTGKYLIVDLVSGKKSHRDSEPAGGWSDLYKTQKMVFRLVPAGVFTMGSPTWEIGRNSSQEDQHVVTLTKPFYIGVFEVTQKQYKNVIGRDPSWFKGDTRPVEKIDYFDVRGKNEGSKWPVSKAFDNDSFLGRLREITGISFDLPTEAQWEYACRAGTTTAWNNNTVSTDKNEDPEMNKLGRYYYNKEDGRGGYSAHTAVGSYLPNAWGLYDMHGNVKEWCLDWFKQAYSGDAVDPVGPMEATKGRVVRGGGHDGWGYSLSKAYKCRSAARERISATSATYDIIGFRLVLVP